MSYCVSLDIHVYIRGKDNAGKTGIRRFTRTVSLSIHPIAYERLTAYALGRLSRSEAAPLEAHLAECPVCRAKVRLWRAIDARLAAEGLSLTPTRPRLVRAPRLAASSWERVGEWLRPWLPDLSSHRLRPALAAAMLALVLIALVAGPPIAAAAQVALPGDMLYPIKTSLENVRLAMVFNTEARVQLRIQLVQTRVGEIMALAEEGRFEDIPVAVAGLEAQVVATVEDVRAVARRDLSLGLVLIEQARSRLAEQNRQLVALQSRADALVQALIKPAIAVTAPNVVAALGQLPVSSLPAPTSMATATLTPTFSRTPPPTFTPVSPTSTAMATPSPTATPVPTRTPTATATKTPTATANATPTANATTTASATQTLTETPTATATATLTPTNTETPTATATLTPTNTETPTATATATLVPTNTPIP